MARLGLLASPLVVRKEGRQQRSQEDKEHPTVTEKLKEKLPEIKVPAVVAQDQGVKREEVPGEAESLKVGDLVLVDR